MKPKIVVIGSINMDLVTTTSAIPKPGETLLGKSFQSNPGGKGANQAVSSALLGANVTLLGCVGDDDMGATCIKNLNEYHIDTSHIEIIPKVTTGIASITVSNAENNIVVVAGANRHVTPDYIRRNEQVIAGSDAILLQLEIPIETAQEAAVLARKHGKQVFLNPSPICPLSDTLIDSCTWIVPNEHEFLQINGVCKDKLVVTKGKEGAIYFEGNGEFSIQSFPVTAVDTTGAGDTFFAAFAVRVLECNKVAEACRFACAAGSIAVTKMGAQSGMPKRNEVEKLLSQQDVIKKNAVMSAAMGEIEFDLVITGGNCLNVYTKEIYQADIGIVDGRIAHITQPGENGLTGKSIYDAKGKTVIPGLIDTHMHIESSMMNPGNFARTVLPHGTTTIIADPHELCNVLGGAGMEYFLESSENIDLRVFGVVPSCVPSVVGLETSKTEFGGNEIDSMLSLPRVLGLAEVMDYPGVIHQGRRMMEILECARKHDKLIEGHAPDLKGGALSAYLASGCESDHETRGVDEAIKKLRAGMVLECRQASNCHDMAHIAKALVQLDYPENATLCTDDREPDDLLNEGHVDHVIRVAIGSGIPPIQAVRMATLHAASLARLRDRGALKAGFLADIVLLDSLNEFIVNEVFVGGKLVARDGKMIQESIIPYHPIESVNTMILAHEPKEEDFQIPYPDDDAKLNTICFHPDDPFFTTLESYSFPMEEGYADINSQENFATIAVFERHGVNGNIACAPIHNIGLKYGAIACTVSHDCHNLFVIGKNKADMVVAARQLVKCGGGFACVKDRVVETLLELPICGLMSSKSVELLSKEVSQLKQTINSMGITSHSPVNLLTAFCLAVIPQVRLTDKGLVDTINQTIIPTYDSNK